MAGRCRWEARAEVTEGLTRALLIWMATATFGNAHAADANSEFKGYMAGMMPKFDRAFNRKDTKFFDRVEAPDFCQRVGGKIVSKPDAMKNMKFSFEQSASMKSRFRLLSARVSGGTGIAMVSNLLTTVSKPSKVEKSHTLVYEMPEEETWVRSGSGWKMKVQELQIPRMITADGKPAYNSPVMSVNHHN